MSDPMVERLLAYEEIRQLAARYAVALDACDLDSLVALFVPDVQVGRAASGRPALREFFAESISATRVTILNVGTHMIDILGPDDARGVVYCRGEIQEGDRWIVQAIQYRDEYQRRDGHWYFLRRKHLLWYGRDVGTSPLGLPPADWPAHSTGKGELPEAWPTWRSFWRVGEYSDAHPMPAAAPAADVPPAPDPSTDPTAAEPETPPAARPPEPRPGGAGRY